MKGSVIMGTVTKSIRVDEDFLKIVDDYNNLVKEMFGASPTVNGVLAHAMVKGLSDNMQIFRLLSSNAVKVSEIKPGEKWNKELSDKAAELVKRYEDYAVEEDIIESEGK